MQYIKLKVFKNNLNNKYKLLNLKVKEGKVGNKYLPPYSKEWQNSIYSFNKSKMKNSAMDNINIYKLIRNYFLLSFRRNWFMNSKHMIRKYKAFIIKRIHLSKPSIKHTSTKAIITLFSAPLCFWNSVNKYHGHTPKMTTTPGLGNGWNSLLNRACLEKVWWIAKLLATELRSVKVAMIRTWLSKFQKPVLSTLGGKDFNNRNGLSHRDIDICWIDGYNGETMMRCAKSTIKVLNGKSKATDFYFTKTAVSATERKLYAAGGPVVSPWCGWRGPVTFQSRASSTGPGRTRNVLERIDSLRRRAEKSVIIDRELYREFILDRDMYLAAYQKLTGSKPVIRSGKSILIWVIRLSNSGNVLKLLIPSPSLNLGGWTNHSLEVKSQKMIEREMDNRGSKSTTFKSRVIVKEQRMNGSQFIAKLNLRYILMSFKKKLSSQNPF